ncbi:Mth938-like domain-containing protein [Amaricoccus sp.]|uniref:Mth938-like domain-containing protein n=1 Tax=Amaricoccus sp. TaxID=1872485 RepID=UPI001B6F2716|nr:Mth938-like domain-containing protein [Amaricoccus sp.]MBP7002424.1 Mth938-like domain-containing protein [Amaricoccus sp.]
MRITEIRYEGAPPVEGYGPGFFRIAGEVREGPQALLPSGLAAWGGLPDIAPFLAEAGRFDVLFLGMGPEIRPLDPALRAALEAAGIGVEIMATPPACRTYNVLLSEGRRIAAGLMPV